MMELAWIVWFLVIPFQAVIWYYGLKHDLDQEKDRRKAESLPGLFTFVEQCERERERQRLEEELK